MGGEQGFENAIQVSIGHPSGGSISFDIWDWNSVVAGRWWSKAELLEVIAWWSIPIQNQQGKYMGRGVDLTHGAKTELPRILEDGDTKAQRLQVGDGAETELVLVVPGHPLPFITYQASYQLQVLKAACVDRKQASWGWSLLSCVSPGHHPRQPGPSFPRLHRVPGGLQSLHLRPQLPRGICLQGKGLLAGEWLPVTINFS